jgi:hypothetical protein
VASNNETARFAEQFDGPARIGVMPAIGRCRIQSNTAATFEDPALSLSPVRVPARHCVVGGHLILRLLSSQALPRGNFWEAFFS